MGMMLRRNLKARAEKSALVASKVKPVVVEEPTEKEETTQQEEPKTDAVWTAEEINKMPYMKLKSVAKQNGIDVENLKAADIRAELIKKLVEV